MDFARADHLIEGYDDFDDPLLQRLTLFPRAWSVGHIVQGKADPVEATVLACARKDYPHVLINLVEPFDQLPMIEEFCFKLMAHRLNDLLRSPTRVHAAHCPRQTAALAEALATPRPFGRRRRG